MDSNFFNAMRLIQDGYKLTGDLPISITEKLSDIEVLYHLCGLVNECQEKVNSITGTTNDYTDSQINNLRDVLTSEVEVLNVTITEMLVKASNYTDEELAKFKTDVTTSITSVNATITSILNENASMKNKIADLQKQIKDADMLVTCPTCGVDMSVQEALYHIYNSIRTTIAWLDFESKMSTYTWDSFDSKMNGATWTQFEYNLNDILALNLETINLENN